MRIKITRGSYNTNSITGELFVDGRFVCHTLELPWKNNQSYVSSIPEGSYPAILRYDKPDKWRIQLDEVPNRTVVQIHTGNFPSHIEGCLLVGNSVKNSSNSIHDSGVAYAALKRSFYGTDTPVSTPDTKLEVIVQFPVRRTEYIYSGNSLLSYEDSGNWKFSLLGVETMTETSRSLEHIYMSGTVGGEKSFLRVPLWGGILAVATNASGPWDVSAGITVTRKD
jgi:Family of unknown function (DUF5675)